MAPSCSMESSLQSYAAASPKSILSWEEGVVPRILDKFWQINLFLHLQLVLTAHYVCCASFCRSVSCFRDKVMGLRISIAISASWWRQPCYARRKSHPLAYAYEQEFCACLSLAVTQFGSFLLICCFYRYTMQQAFQGSLWEPLCFPACVDIRRSPCIVAVKSFLSHPSPRKGRFL